MYVLIRRFHKAFLVLLLLSMLSGCGGGSSNVSSSLTTASPSDSALQTLTSGLAVDVSSFNDKIVYALITAEPSAYKPESNSASSNNYSFTLSSTAGTTNSLVGSTLSTTVSTSNTAATLYSAAQIACDNMFRTKEKKLLASKAKQFSKKSSSLLKAAAPGSVALNTTWTGVYIYDYSANTNGELTTINTTCRYVSDDAYFFVDDADYDKTITDAKLVEYGKAFDDIIYPNDHRHFGEENDTDGNKKIIIVFSGKLTSGVLGYFNSSDKYAYSQTYDDSNEGDIIYVTTDTSYAGSEISEESVMETIAHEFQHMIYFDEHYNKGVANTYTWLNEALSQAAEYYCGYTSTHLAWIKVCLSDSLAYDGIHHYLSGLSLTYWTGYNYGLGALFIRYLIDQYGDKAIKNMCSTQYVGIKAVENATGVSFNTIFTNFTRALAMLGTSYSGETVYRFTSADLASLQTTGRGGLLPLSTTLSAGSRLSGSGPPYSINFYRCSGTFGTMILTGSSVTGTVFGLSD